MKKLTLMIQRFPEVSVYGRITLYLATLTLTNLIMNLVLCCLTVDLFFFLCACHCTSVSLKTQIIVAN